jgi:hypothetical protein
MDPLYDYLFHFNHYQGLWNAIPRAKYLDYWTNDNTEGVLKAKEIHVLIDLISRGQEFIDTIN